MKRFIALTIIVMLLQVNAWAEDIIGVVTDEAKQPLPYSTVRLMGKRIACLTDSAGRFRLSLKKNSNENDTLLISYLGYKTQKVPMIQLKGNSPVNFKLTPAPKMLNGVYVYPNKKIKTKTKKKGKKHSWALLRSYIDGLTAGECFGYEFHTKKDRTLVLDKVGFFCCDGLNRMTEMKFRINVYDMKSVKKSPSKDFVSVLDKPIYFDYMLIDNREGKFEYELPQQIVLPEHAMVEIEMLENLNEKRFWFKSNLIGRKTWSKFLSEDEWIQDPFGTPFFIECIEIK